MQTKICKDCQTEKSVEEFYGSPHTKDKKVSYCKPCQAIRVKSNPNRNKNLRRGQLKYLYGITLEDYDRMALEQEHLCAICFRPELSANKHLCVDHDHETGKVRALLCHRCNLGLGKFDDNMERLENAIDYLKKYI